MAIVHRPIASTIKDQVYQILKEEICGGAYQPGQWLQEKELANRLSVSRSPIREALRQLAGDGLVCVCGSLYMIGQARHDLGLC